jgi:hypothetical protein
MSRFGRQILTSPFAFCPPGLLLLSFGQKGKTGPCKSRIFSVSPDAGDRHSPVLDVLECVEWLCSTRSEKSEGGTLQQETKNKFFGAPGASGAGEGGREGGEPNGADGRGNVTNRWLPDVRMRQRRCLLGCDAYDL